MAPRSLQITTQTSTEGQNELLAYMEWAQARQQGAKQAGEPEDEPLKQPDASLDVLIAIRRHLKRERCEPEVEKVILTELPGWLSSKSDTPQKTKDNNTGLSVGLKKVAKVIASQERGQALHSLHTVREILADPAVNTSRGTPQEKGGSTHMISSEVIEIMAYAGPKAAPFGHKRTRRRSS